VLQVVLGIRTIEQDPALQSLADKSNVLKEAIRKLDAEIEKLNIDLQVLNKGLGEDTSAADKAAKRFKNLANSFEGLLGKLDPTFLDQFNFETSSKVLTEIRKDLLGVAAQFAGLEGGPDIDEFVKSLDKVERRLKAIGRVDLKALQDIKDATIANEFAAKATLAKGDANRTFLITEALVQALLKSKIALFREEAVEILRTKDVQDDFTREFLKNATKQVEAAQDAKNALADAKAIDILNKEIVLLQKEFDLTFATTQQRERDLAILKLRQQFLTRGQDPEGRDKGAFDAQTELIAAREAQEELNARAEEFRDTLKSGFADSVDILGEGLIDAFKKGENAAEAFRDVMLKILDRLSDAFLELALNFAKQALGLDSRGGGGGLTELLGGLFGFGGGGGGLGAGTTGFVDTSVGSSIGTAGFDFGLASGGKFKVGGSGGTDSQLIAFKASPNETVSVRTPKQMELGDRAFNNDGGGGGVTIIMDLRGSNGDASIEKAVQLGIANAAPVLIGASIQRVRDERARDPQFFS